MGLRLNARSPGWGSARHLDRGTIEEIDATLGIGRVDRCRQRLEEIADALLLFAQAVLQLFGGGNILGDAHALRKRRSEQRDRDCGAQFVCRF
jgi:hypothetical protein